MKKLFVAIILLVIGFNMSIQAQERVVLSNDSTLNVFIVGEASSESPKPLLILMGGGAGNASISRDTSQWLGSGFAQRGWLVAVPISPNNQSFRGANNSLIPLLIDELQKRAGVLPGKALLAGVSNGGMSALEIARTDPRRYYGVAAVPALFTEHAENSNLAEFPVYLRIGGQDQLGWADRFNDTVTTFNEAGVDLDAAILDSAPHMFRMDWSTLGPWLQRFQ